MLESAMTSRVATVHLQADYRTCLADNEHLHGLLLLLVTCESKPVADFPTHNETWRFNQRGLHCVTSKVIVLGSALCLLHVLMHISGDIQGRFSMLLKHDGCHGLFCYLI